MQNILNYIYQEAAAKMKLDGLEPTFKTIAMTIFEFKYKRDESVKDWVFAADEEDAVEFYENHSGLDAEEIKERHTIKEIPKEKWSNYSVFDVDSWNEEEGEYDVTQTFEEYASENTIRDIIATTEY